MSKEIYTCDACHYTFEAETGCDQCPDCGKKRVRPADEQESKEYLGVRSTPRSGIEKLRRKKQKWLPEMIWSSW